LGKYSIINLYKNTDSVLESVFERITINISLIKQKENIKSFLLCGSEPKVGTTTIAINLAISMASAGWKTVLIDGDLRKTTEHKRLTENLEYGLTDYLKGNMDIIDVIYKTNYNFLNYIPWISENENPISLLHFKKLDEFSNIIQRAYDYILFDFPSISSSLDSLVMAKKLGTVILITSQYASHDILRESKTKIEKAGARLAGVIVNKLDKNDFNNSTKYSDYLIDKRYI